MNTVCAGCIILCVSYENKSVMKKGFVIPDKIATVCLLLYIYSNKSVIAFFMGILTLKHYNIQYILNMDLTNFTTTSEVFLRCTVVIDL